MRMSTLADGRCLIASRPWRGSCRCCDDPATPEKGTSEVAEEIMEIPERFDLTGSLRDATELAGCFAEHGGPVMWPIGRLGHIGARSGGASTERDR